MAEHTKEPDMMLFTDPAEFKWASTCLHACAGIANPAAIDLAIRVIREIGEKAPYNVGKLSHDELAGIVSYMNDVIKCCGRCTEKLKVKP